MQHHKEDVADLVTVLVGWFAGYDSFHGDALTPSSNSSESPTADAQIRTAVIVQRTAGDSPCAISRGVHPSSRFSDWLMCA